MTLSIYIYYYFQMKQDERSVASWCTAWPGSVGRWRSLWHISCTRSPCRWTMHTTTSNVASLTYPQTSTSWDSWWTTNGRWSSNEKWTGAAEGWREASRMSVEGTATYFRLIRATIWAGVRTPATARRVSITRLASRRPPAVCHLCRRRRPRLRHHRRLSITKSLRSWSNR